MPAHSETYAAILGATAQIDWHTLEPHFARGELLVVDRVLDLVVVAQAFTEDASDKVKQWMDKGQLAIASDEQASDWFERNPDTLWAVVIRPWVLVQERS